MFDEGFLRQIDGVLARAGASNRSDFIRMAVYRALEKAGVKVDLEQAVAPSRAGKGGRPKKIIPISRVAEKSTGTYSTKKHRKPKP
jgi:hypothetical protein